MEQQQWFGDGLEVLGNLSKEWHGATIPNARAEIQRRARDGLRCPCCEQWVKVYRNPFRWSAALVIAELMRVQRKDLCLGAYFHLPTLLEQTDWSRYGLKPRAVAALRGGGGSVVSPLLDWALIEKQPGERGDGDWRSGYYRLMPAGIDFADAARKIPKYVYVYDGRTLGFDGPDISIRDAARLRFDYDAVMKG